MRKALLCVLLCCVAMTAMAEGVYSAQDVTYTRLAALDGAVYCLEGPSMIFGDNDLLRVSLTEKTKVRGSINGWDSLYAAGDQLLLIRDVLNLGEVLGSHPSSEHEAELYDPATGRMVRLGRFRATAEEGTIRIFAAGDRVWRTVRDGDRWELQRLTESFSPGRWEVAAAWTGGAPDLRSTFCVFGDGVRTWFYEYATGVGYDVTVLLKRGEIPDWSGLLEDGVLYQARGGWLEALKLTDGETTRLMRLGNDPLDGFLLSPSRTVIVYGRVRGEYRAEVYDRSTWELMSIVPFAEYPMDVLLEGTLLCIGNPYNGAGVQVIDLTTGESVRHALN